MTALIAYGVGGSQRHGDRSHLAGPTWPVRRSPLAARFGGAVVDDVAVPDPADDTGGPRSAPDLVSALAEILIRRCTGRPRRGDTELARGLAQQLGADDLPRDMFAVGSLGFWAGFGTRPMDDDTTAEVVRLCRALLRTRLPVQDRTLTCAALGLLAERGATDQAAVDFVNVATAARSVEQHALALWAAREALRRRADLSASHQALTLLTVAVITREPSAIEEAYALADALDDQDIAARSARELEPTLRGDGSLTAVGEAVRARDRRSAAEHLAEVFADLRTSAGNTDDDLLAGLHDTFTALALPAIDVERARRGLVRVVGHLRGRQRFGEVPPVARAGVDMVADLLALEADPAAADVLTGFVEALADAGLSEVSAIPGEGVPAVLQAQLAHLAQSAPIWPDLAACLRGLRGRCALVLRQQRSLSTGRPTFLALFVTPPDGLAVKAVRLDEDDAATLARLGGGRLEEVTSVSTLDLERLIAEFLPRGLTERAAAGRLRSLVVVPDGPAWAVPWQAAGVLAATDVTLAPSLGVHARVPVAAGPVGDVTAIVDESAPAAKVVKEALATAGAAGFDVRLPRTLADAAPGDLLLVYTHGGGVGLGFSAGAAENPLSALTLAASRYRTVLVAACSSSAVPPVAYPLNLPAALLLNGASTVAGGLWPLPARDTARIVAAVVRSIAGGTDFRRALARARTEAPDLVGYRWGLAIHGGPAPT